MIVFATFCFAVSFGDIRYLLIQNDMFSIPFENIKYKFYNINEILDIKRTVAKKYLTITEVYDKLIHVAEIYSENK